MQTLNFSVHEFMIIMGILSERVSGGADLPSTSVWHAWKARYTQLDKDLESLDMMRRADMLFDGKVKMDNVTKPQIEELMGVVDEHMAYEQGLVDEGDFDADEEEVQIWKTVRARLETSMDWQG